MQPSWAFRSSLAAWSPPSRRPPSRALAACLPSCSVCDRSTRQVPEGTPRRRSGCPGHPGGRLQADLRRAPRLHRLLQVSSLCPAHRQGGGEGGGEVSAPSRNVRTFSARGNEERQADKRCSVAPHAVRGHLISP